jgi:hypothetical protein
LRVTSSRNRSKKVFITPPSPSFFYGIGKPQTRLDRQTLSGKNPAPNPFLFRLFIR